jgi:hypothetical protein
MNLVVLLVYIGIHPMFELLEPLKSTCQCPKVTHEVDVRNNVKQYPLVQVRIHADV